MQVDLIDGRYVVRCAFEERFLPAGAGFKFDPSIKRWVTHSQQTALTLGADVLTDRARASMGITATIPVPDGLEYLDFQTGGIKWGLAHQASLIADQPGLGKGHPVTTPILTPSGYRALGTLKIGDEVIGSDGRGVLVTGVFPRGVIPVYRVVFADGASILADAEHLWTLDGEDDPVDTLELSGRLAAGGRPAIPVMSAPAVHPVCLHTLAPTAAGIDGANRFGLGIRREHRWPHGAREFCADFTPYAEGAVHQRLAFLSAVVRTIGRIRDGNVRLRVAGRPGAAEFVTVVCDVVRRLGGVVAVSGARNWTLDIALAPQVAWPVFGYPAGRPGKVARRWRDYAPKRLVREVVGVMPAGRDEVRCISVRAADRLYVADQAIVTHNTIQGIGIANATPNLRSGLIVAPASLRKNWLKEWSKWTVHPHLSIDIAYGSNFPSSDIVIINPDILDRHRAKLRSKERDCVVVDESHYFMSDDSRRSKGLYGGFEKVPVTYLDSAGKQRTKQRTERIVPIPYKRLVLMSGTPIPNKISNFWTTVRACDPLGLGRNKEDFCRAYAGGYADMGGFVWDGETKPEKLAELNALAKQRFMIRRLKADVLKDLPDKIRQIVPLPVDGLRKAAEAEKATLLDLLDSYEKIVGIRKDMSDADLIDAVLKISPATWEKYAKTQDESAGTIDLPLTRLARARQDLAVAKLPMVIEYVQNLLDTGEKVIVFGYHQAVIQGLLAHFADKIGTACIYGKTPMESKTPGRDRQAQADRFQNDPDCRLFIGQYTAAGVGWTLTEACHVVFAELTWVPHELLQAEDRAHRIGQLATVWAHHLCVQGSLDDTFIAKLIEKMRVIELALD